MNASPFQSSARTAASRVIGATSLMFVILVGTLLLARPEMMMTAMHRAMDLIFIP